jgi:hypothetical protein
LGLGSTWKTITGEHNMTKLSTEIQTFDLILCHLLRFTLYSRGFPGTPPQLCSWGRVLLSYQRNHINSQLLVCGCQVYCRERHTWFYTQDVLKPLALRLHVGPGPPFNLNITQSCCQQTLSKLTKSCHFSGARPEKIPAPNSRVGGWERKGLAKSPTNPCQALDKL